jgi:hypothetical protein
MMIVRPLSWSLLKSAESGEDAFRTQSAVVTVIAVAETPDLNV